MKNYIKKTLFYFCLMAFSAIGVAQPQNSVFTDSSWLDTATNTVRFSIKTSDSFIVGANRYVLHIGGKHFLRNEHPEGRLDEIVFFIPLEDYKNLEPQAKVVLVYGLYHENTLQDNEGNQSNGFTGAHWILGSFTPEKQITH